MMYLFSLLFNQLNYIVIGLTAAKMWCYCRMVYMPMSYLYGKRFVASTTPLILQLREELYDQPYHQINWQKMRHCCASVTLISLL